MATAGLIVLAAMLLTRLARYRPAVVADARSPVRAFGFFTVVAGLDVLGLRAVAISASLLAAAWPGLASTLVPVAACLWCVGVVLYAGVAALIVLRWLTVPVTPATLRPPYWLLMGATAISVRAGAQLLALPAGLPARAATASVVAGLSYLLWSIGTWWIPLLVLLGCWRHLVRRWPLRYEADLWSIVFPLGMYSAATEALGRAAKLGFMTPVAHVMLWAAIAAWLAVATAAVTSLVRRPPATAATGSPPPGRRE
jgi:tellurite resistance protein TehA-like permease